MSPKELQKDVDDLKTALKTIGTILVNESLKQSQRTDRILGILSMYECEPTNAPNPR
jgi:hypothetical protein